MAKKRRTDFCTECRKETEYLLQKKDIVKKIRDREYTLELTVAICAECGGVMNIPGLIDRNIQEIDGQYRAVEHLVTIEDIENMMKIYRIGKAPLSLCMEERRWNELHIMRLHGRKPGKDMGTVFLRVRFCQKKES